MPTALLAWELGSGMGHCVNLAPIAKGLVDRGWNVWVAARDVAVAERVIRHANVRYMQAPFLIGKAAHAIAPTRSFAYVLHNIGFGDDAQLRVLVSAWQGLFDFIRPQVLVCEHAPTALLASRRFNARRVVVGTGFFSPPDVSPLPELRYWVASNPAELVGPEGTILDRVNGLLQSQDLPKLNRIAQLYAEVDENILLTFSELDHYPQRGNATYWGMWTLPQKVMPSWPVAAGPKIFAYLKQMGSGGQMSALLSALREVRCPTLVYVVDGDPAWLRQFHSPRLRFITEPVDIQAIGRECEIAVLNGNAGTATELLLAGVPQLHVPLYLEQEVFCRRVVELGAALGAAPSRPEQFAVRLMTLIHEIAQYREAAQQFAAKYSSHDPQNAICQIVNRIVKPT